MCSLRKEMPCKSIASGTSPSSPINANFVTNLVKHYGIKGGCGSWFPIKFLTTFCHKSCLSSSTMKFFPLRTLFTSHIRASVTFDTSESAIVCLDSTLSWEVHSAPISCMIACETMKAAQHKGWRVAHRDNWDTIFI